MEGEAISACYKHRNGVLEMNRDPFKQQRSEGIIDSSIDGMPEYGKSSNFHPIHLGVAFVIFFIVALVYYS